MSFLFGRKKTSPPEDMRMRFRAPSFSFKVGEVLNVWDREEAKTAFAQCSESIVILHPGVNVMSYPQDWAKLMDSFGYLVVCGDKSSREMKALVAAVERVIFSPVQKKLSGISVVESEKEAAELVTSVFTGSSFPHVFTVNNTEEESL